ncbi:helix-turn-helix transcriptional regulator [Streptomyces sp. LRE541]|nr:helix-turn-helix transcriptional regulator [Streptomyces sp. LRE541]UPZ26436.1 helix-turn-helix transcriptional regulator [Streptomyces sp. LRE541]
MTSRSRTGFARGQLTVRELHIARLVATRATPREVASRLFSPRTVDAHLRSVYRKLGINSRLPVRGRPRRPVRPGWRGRPGSPWCGRAGRRSRT